MTEIKSNEELRAAVTVATNSLYVMCNTKDQTELLSAFVVVKDNLVEIFKYNQLRISDK